MSLLFVQSPDISIERIEEVGIERENAAKLHHYLTMTGGMDLVQVLQEDETLNQHLDVPEAIEEMQKFLNYCTNEFHIPSEVCICTHACINTVNAWWMYIRIHTYLRDSVVIYTHTYVLKCTNYHDIVYCINIIIILYYFT